MRNVDSVETAFTCHLDFIVAQYSATIYFVSKVTQSSSMVYVKLPLSSHRRAGPVSKYVKVLTKTDCAGEDHEQLT
jgi:hypothetical protein